MVDFSKYGISVPSILLPKNIPLDKWSVIACDQYTQDVGYWQQVQKAVGKSPSTLHLILPEVFLNDKDKDARIKKIKDTMQLYLKTGVFADSIHGFVFLKRNTGVNNRCRCGLMAAVDLDAYEWQPGAKALIRATEATIKQRIPPRLQIRQGAALELPHIMLLVNDSQNIIFDTAQSLAQKENSLPLYKGDFMSGSGSIEGYYIKQEDSFLQLENAFAKVAKQNTINGDTFLFATGDGNHSLATAKAVWDIYKDAYKKTHSQKECDVHIHPLRYALAEIVNIYDSALVFYPIHRVLFGCNIQKLCAFIQNKIKQDTQQQMSLKEVTSLACLKKSLKENSNATGFVNQKQNKYYLLFTKKDSLTVGYIQPLLDEFLATQQGSSIDYIHGEKEVLTLSCNNDTIGVIMNDIKKDDFFATISKTGTLPRKSFSIGEACEKRFYLEARKISNDLD